MFNALIKAGRVLNVGKITDLTAAYSPNAPFSVFLTPASGSLVEVGDNYIITGCTAYGEAEGEIPVVVGDWSPVVFRSISASGIDLTEVDCYVAPIELER